MPELPDITVYIEALRRRIAGRRLTAIRLRSPFVLRTVTPPIKALEGREVRAIERIGKRIAIAFDEELHLVIHLMRLGRLRWTDDGKGVGGKVLLATFAFESGTLHLVEMGPKKRAAIHVVQGRAALDAFVPGGVEPLEVDVESFAAALRAENHTIKRSLTDPRIVSGVGNAYSDEILHAAKLSPIALTSKLSDEDMRRLHAAMQTVLRRFTAAIATEVGEGFPEKVTAFRPDMAAHGRFNEPCPVCGSPIQRIVYADRETNYCANCQTGGRPLADRALSRLLGKDWPKTLEDLEERRHGGSKT